MGCLFSKKGNIDFHGGNENQVNHDDVHVQVNDTTSEGKSSKIYGNNNILKEKLGKDEKAFTKDGQTFAKHGETFAKDGQTFAKDGETFAKDGETFAKDKESLRGNTHTSAINVQHREVNNCEVKNKDNDTSEVLPPSHTEEPLPPPQPHRKYRKDVIPDVKAAFSRVDSHADEAPDTEFNNLESLAYYLTNPNITEAVKIERANVVYHED